MWSIAWHRLKKLKFPRASGLGWDFRFPYENFCTVLCLKWILLQVEVKELLNFVGSKPTQNYYNSSCPWLMNFQRHMEGWFLGWIFVVLFLCLMWGSRKATYCIFFSFPNSCWLHVDNYFIWSFIGPVTFIILVSRLPFHSLSGGHCSTGIRDSKLCPSNC